MLRRRGASITVLVATAIASVATIAAINLDRYANHYLAGLPYGTTPLPARSPTWSTTSAPCRGPRRRPGLERSGHARDQERPLPGRQPGACSPSSRRRRSTVPCWLTSPAGVDRLGVPGGAAVVGRRAVRHRVRRRRTAPSKRPPLVPRRDAPLRIAPIRTAVRFRCPGRRRPVRRAKPPVFASQDCRSGRFQLPQRWGSPASRPRPSLEPSAETGARAVPGQRAPGWDGWTPGTRGAPGGPAAPCGSGRQGARDTRGRSRRRADDAAIRCREDHGVLATLAVDLEVVAARDSFPLRISSRVTAATGVPSPAPRIVASARLRRPRVERRLAADAPTALRRANVWQAVGGDVLLQLPEGVRSRLVGPDHGPWKSASPRPARPDTARRSAARRWG